MWSLETVSNMLWDCQAGFQLSSTHECNQAVAFLHLGTKISRPSFEFLQISLCQKFMDITSNWSKK